jgi:hypothetical protein
VPLAALRLRGLVGVSPAHLDGLQVTQPAVAAALGVILAYLIYEAGRWLEQRAGDSAPARIARLVGRWLLSLGLDTGQPTYGLPPSRSQSVAELYPDGRPRQITSTTTWPPRPQ